MQAGPDTGHGTWDYVSGYRYADTNIWGFSQTHLVDTQWMLTDNPNLATCVLVKLGLSASGSEDQFVSFYTSLYHLFFQPNNIADVGEKPFYSTFSCWDTFRAAYPLYTVLMPDLAADFVDSMLEQGQRTGFLPIWTLWGKDNQCMIGTHSVPVIVDAWLKGCWPAPVVEDNDGTVEHAYAQIKETLTKKYVREVFDKFYLPKPDGLCGNDDCGQMSAWYLFSAMGFYPFDPCGDVHYYWSMVENVRVGRRVFRIARGEAEPPKAVGDLPRSSAI